MQRKRTRWSFSAALLIALSTLIFGIPVLAQTDDAQANPSTLGDDETEYKLGKYMAILEDPGRNLTIEDVSSSAYTDLFTPSQNEAPNFGFTDSAYWVRFRLRNESRLTDHWLLEVDFANMQYADLYLPEGGGFVSRQTGSLLPFSTRDIAFHRIVFDVPVPRQEDHTFYMRFQNGASMTLPLTIWLPEAFFQASSTESLFLGVFYGVFLIMLVYNLFLLASLRDASYLYFVCFLVSGILLFASYDGLAHRYLWPDLVLWNRFSIPLFFILFMVSIVKFTDDFLKAGARIPRFHQLIMFVLAGWGIAILLLPFVSYRFIMSLITPFGVLSLGVAGVAGLISWGRGYLPARFYLFAWLGLLIGGSITLLVRLGLVPSTTFTEQFYRLGIIWMVAFWAIALADRINLLKAEKEKANLEVQASEARYRQLVETMNDGLGVIDEYARFTYVNDRLAEMLGYQANEIIGHLMTELANEENRQILTDQLAKRKTGESTPYEVTWRRKDGSDLFTIVSPMPLFDAGRQYKGAFAVITDITERVQASRLLEKRVAERTNELATLLELSHEITTTRGLDYQMIRTLERLAMIVDYHHAVILMLDKEDWRIGASWPASRDSAEDLLFSGEEARSLVALFESGTPLIMNNHSDVELPNRLPSVVARLSKVFPTDVCPWLGIPLLSKDRLIGVLILGRAGQGGFPDDQLKVAVAFANQAAIVIENSQLLDQVQATAAAKERNRLARDLHDSVTQTLFTASVLAEATPRIWDRDPGIARKNMEKLSVLIRGALAEMRALLFELRSGGLHNQTLGQLLTTLAEAARARTHAAISVSLGDEPKLPENVTLAFYRIAQEALNNAINHTEATQINFAVLQELDRVKLHIQDNGRGFDPQAIPAGHLGISIMAERAGQIGGELQIQSEPGQGTEIIVTWPKQGGPEKYG